MDQYIIDQLLYKADRIRAHIIANNGGAWDEHHRHKQLLVKMMGPGHVRIFPSDLDHNDAYIDFKNIRVNFPYNIHYGRPSQTGRKFVDLGKTIFENRTKNVQAERGHKYTHTTKHRYITLPGDKVLRELKKRFQGQPEIFDSHHVNEINNDFKEHWGPDITSELDYKVEVSPLIVVIACDRKQIVNYDQDITYYYHLISDIEIYSEHGYKWHWKDDDDMANGLRGNGDQERWSKAPLVDTKIDILTKPIDVQIQSEAKFIETSTGNIVITERISRR